MDLPIDATLPPIDPSTLEQNPGFSILYKDLCTRKLNADGSSKDVKRMKRQGELHDVSRNAGPGFVAIHISNILLSTSFAHESASHMITCCHLGARGHPYPILTAYFYIRSSMIGNPL